MDRWHIYISLIASLLSCHQFQGAIGSWRPSGWSFHDGESASPAPGKPWVGNGANDHSAVVKPVSLALGNCALVSCDAEAGAQGPTNIRDFPVYCFQLFGNKHISPHSLLADCGLSFEQSALLWFIPGNLQISVQIGKSLFESCKIPVFLNVHHRGQNFLNSLW